MKDVSALEFLNEAILQTRSELKLIGFCGVALTLASYLRRKFMRVTSLKGFVPVLFFGLLLSASSTAYADAW